MPLYCTLECLVSQYKKNKKKGIEKEGRKCLTKQPTNNMFYLQVNDHSDIKRGNPLPPLHGLLFLISSKVSFIVHPTDRIVHTMASVAPVVEHWLPFEIVHWVHQDGSMNNQPQADATTCSPDTECQTFVLCQI